MQDEVVRVFLGSIEITANTLLEILKAMIHNKDAMKHGQQSLKDLNKQNRQMESLKIPQKDIKNFQKEMKNYSVDYSLKLDRGSKEYTIFFKTQDSDRVKQTLENVIKKAAGKTKENPGKADPKDPANVNSEKDAPKADESPGQEIPLNGLKGRGEPLKSVEISNKDMDLLRQEMTIYGIDYSVEKVSGDQSVIHFNEKYLATVSDIKYSVENHEVDLVLEPDQPAAPIEAKTVSVSSIKSENLEPVKLDKADLKDIKDTLHKNGVDLDLKKNLDTGEISAFFKGQNQEQIYKGLDKSLQDMQRDTKKPFKDLVAEAEKRMEKANAEKALDKEKDIGRKPGRVKDRGMEK